MPGATILVVESEPGIADKLQNKLKKLGYHVPEIAVSCQEAIHKAEQIQPDLVLMDVQSEGSANSLDLAEKLRSSFTIPVAYVAPYSDQQSLENIRLAQPNARLINTLRDRELKATIEMTLYDHHSQGKLKEMKQWLVNKLGRLSEALSAIDEISEASGEEERSAAGYSLTAVETDTVKKTSLQVISAGTEVLSQGERIRDVYSIEQGLVKLIRHEAQGKEAIAAIRYPGWLLGASWAVLGEPLPVTAVAVTQCRLNRIGVSEFLSLMRSNTEVSWRLHRMLAREVHNLIMQLTGVECLSARQRLEELLWQLIAAMESQPGKKPIRVLFPAKYSEIAQILGVTPQYLSWLIGQLEKDGIAKRDKGWVIVFHPEKLWHREELDESSYSFGSFC